MFTNAEQIRSDATLAANYAEISKEAAKANQPELADEWAQNAQEKAKDAVKLMEKDPSAAAEAAKTVKDSEGFTVALRDAAKNGLIDENHKVNEGRLNALAEHKFQTSSKDSTKLTLELADTAARHTSPWNDGTIADFYAKQAVYANAGADHAITNADKTVQAAFNFAKEQTHPDKDPAKNELQTRNTHQNHVEIRHKLNTLDINIKALATDISKKGAITAENQTKDDTQELRQIAANLKVSGIAADDQAPLSKEQIQNLQMMLEKQTGIKLNHDGKVEGQTLEAMEKVVALATPGQASSKIQALG